MKCLYSVFMVSTHSFIIIWKLHTSLSFHNLTFFLLFLGCLCECMQLLVKAERLPEAAFFARTYLPSKIPEVVELWRTWLGQSTKSNAKIAHALANPKDYPNLFPGLEVSVFARLVKIFSSGNARNNRKSDYGLCILPPHRRLYCWFHVCLPWLVRTRILSTTAYG